MKNIGYILDMKEKEIMLEILFLIKNRQNVLIMQVLIKFQNLIIKN